MPTATIVNRSARADVQVKSAEGAIIGRAEFDLRTDGPSFVYLRQTYGGSSEGTLTGPLVKCDVEVLRAIIAAIDTEKAGGA